MSGGVAMRLPCNVAGMAAIAHFSTPRALAAPLLTCQPHSPPNCLRSLVNHKALPQRQRQLAAAAQAALRLRPR